MPTVLAGLAEFEREPTRSRRGRARAKAEGCKMGRPRKLTPRRQRETLARRNGGENLPPIVRSCNAHHAAISRPCT